MLPSFLTIIEMNLMKAKIGKLSLLRAMSPLTIRTRNVSTGVTAEMLAPYQLRQI